MRAAGPNGGRVEPLALRCLVFRGLVKEAEEEINKFLSTHDVRVLHMAQSETGDHISVTLIVEEPGHLPEDGF